MLLTSGMEEVMITGQDRIHTSNDGTAYDNVMVTCQHFLPIRIFSYS